MAEAGAVLHLPADLKILSLEETVENIFSFLPARSLVRASQVCRLWKDVAKKVLKRRKRWICRLFKWDKHEVCAFHLEGELCEFFNNINTVPSPILVTTNGLCDGKKDFDSFVLRTQAKLPVGCPVLGCHACGVIGETSSGYPKEWAGHPEEWAGYPEEWAGNWSGLSVLVVPKVKGVNVDLFSFSFEEICNVRRNEQSWEDSFGSLVKQDIKFVFLVGDEEKPIREVVTGIRQALGEHVVIVGGLGVAFAMINDKSKVESSGIIGLAIGGSVEASSVVHHGHSVQSLSDSFKRLSKGQPPERSACFMVSCIGRGTYLYGAKDVESTEFKKMFPDLRLFGFFGDGEIGMNMPHKCEQYKENPYEEFWHSNSTIFGMLTILDVEEGQ